MSKFSGVVDIPFPTVFDTDSPKKKTPIKLKRPPIRTATLRESKPAPTAGVMVSSLAPIVNATTKPRRSAAPKIIVSESKKKVIIGSAIAIHPSLKFNCVLR